MLGVSFMFLLWGNTVYASEKSDWEQAAELDSTVTVEGEMEVDDDQVTTSASNYYHEILTGSIRINSGSTRASSIKDSQSIVEPLAVPVSSIHANGETTRNGRLGSSYVQVTLMQSGRTISTQSSSAVISKTANATASTYPGSVPNGTEFRALGVHRASVNNSGSVQGRTGTILQF